MKLTGAVLVLLGAFWGIFQYANALRKELSLIRDLSGALTQLSGEIRWKNSTLPEGIRSLHGRKSSGPYFRTISEMLKGQNTLQEAWNNTFTNTSQEITEILCNMEWGGDSQRQEGAILYAARRMTELGEAKQSVLRQREKLCAAAALSAAGVLVMILM